MNYSNAKLEMVKAKDKFGRGYTYDVFLTEGTNKEVLYHGGNDKKAYEIFNEVSATLSQMKEGK
jgi:hypothetical protein